MIEAHSVMQQVVAALKHVRIVQAGLSEQALVDLMVQELDRAGLVYRREQALGARSRIDIVVPDGDLLVGIEAKRRRPNETTVKAQVLRYAKTGKLSGIVFVAERAFDLPPEIAGIPVASVSLHANHGISL